MNVPVYTTRSPGGSGREPTVMRVVPQAVEHAVRRLVQSCVHVRLSSGARSMLSLRRQDHVAGWAVSAAADVPAQPTWTCANCGIKIWLSFIEQPNFPYCSEDCETFYERGYEPDRWVDGQITWRTTCP